MVIVSVSPVVFFPPIVAVTLPALFVPSVIVSVAPPLVVSVNVELPTAMVNTADADVAVTLIAASAEAAFIADASEDAIDESVSPYIAV